MKRSSSEDKGTVKLGTSRKEAVTEILGLELSEIIRSGVHQSMLDFCRLFVDLLINTEVQERAGRRYEHNSKRECSRWGSQNGSVYMLGQKAEIEKPRLRNTNKGVELELETHKALNDKRLLNEQTASKMLAGVSTRKYATTVEKLTRSAGISRQSVSRKGIAFMSAQLDEFRKRSLVGLNILVIFIDGIGLADRQHIAAIGVDTDGKKHLLGIKQGATENSGVCIALIADLINRGLKPEGGYLFVIDGSKALAKSITSTFGKQALIQRCLLHKIRNLKDYLSKTQFETIRQKMHAAFNKPSHREAEKAFDLLRRELLLISPSAANSLTDGLQQLLTLHRIGIKGILRRSLSTTNCIESIFSSARYYSRNIKRWRNEEQMDRWLATGLLEAEKHLKRILGYTQLPKLAKAIEKEIEKQNKKVAQ